MRYTVGTGSGVKRKVYFDCPACRSPVDSILENAGQKLPCPACNHELVVPGLAELKVVHAEEASREAKRREEQRLREEKAAAEARARAEREAAEERAEAERREKKKRAAEKRKLAAAAKAQARDEAGAAARAPAKAPVQAAAPAAARSPALAGAATRGGPAVPVGFEPPGGGETAGESAGGTAEGPDPFAGLDFTEAPQPQANPVRRSRRLVGIPAVILLLAIGVVAALWVRSERVETRIEWGNQRPDRATRHAVHSQRGAISYERRTQTDENNRLAPSRTPLTRSERPATSPRVDHRGFEDREQFLGFGYFHDGFGHATDTGWRYHWELIVPYWAVCVLLAAPALFSIIRRARRRR